MANRKLTKNGGTVAKRTPREGLPTGRKPSLTPDAETLRIIRLCASFQATQEETAARLEVADSTFRKFLAEHEIARNAWHDARLSGLVSQRATTFRLGARNGAVCIFIAKNYLGMDDKHEFTTPDGAPLQLQHEHVVKVVTLNISAPGKQSRVIEQAPDAGSDTVAADAPADA